MSCIRQCQDYIISFCLNIYSDILGYKYQHSFMSSPKNTIPFDCVALLLCPIRSESFVARVRTVFLSLLQIMVWNNVSTQSPLQQLDPLIDVYIIFNQAL